MQEKNKVGERGKRERGCFAIKKYLNNLFNTLWIVFRQAKRNNQVMERLPTDVTLTEIPLHLFYRSKIF
jgi:hypothetical protein